MIISPPQVKRQEPSDKPSSNYRNVTKATRKRNNARREDISVIETKDDPNLYNDYTDREFKDMVGKNAEVISSHSSFGENDSGNMNEHRIAGQYQSKINKIPNNQKKPSLSRKRAKFTSRITVAQMNSHSFMENQEGYIKSYDKI